MPTTNIGANAEIGHSIEVQWVCTTPTVDQTFKVLSVDGPDLSADAVEKTHSGSTNRWREFIAGLKDAGEVSLEINFDANEPVAVGNEGTLTITFPLFNAQTTPAAFSSAAVSTGFTVSEPIEDRMTATVKFKLSGEPTWTDGS